MKKTDGALNARCERCSARKEGKTRDELAAAGWLPCPRKGGKLAWMCAECNPVTRGTKPGPGLSTGDMVERTK